MEALKQTLSQPISSLQKPISPIAQTKMAFASLLESLRLEATDLLDEQVTTEERLEHIETLLTSLHQLPIEAQAEIHYALSQLRELKTEDVLNDLHQTSQATATIKSAELEADIRGLLEKIQQHLPTLTTTFVALAEFKGEADKNMHMNNLHAAEVLNQLEVLIDVLEHKQGRLPVEENKALVEMPRIITEMNKPIKEFPKLPVDTQSVFKKMEAVELQLVPKIQRTEEELLVKDPDHAKIVQELPVPPATLAVGEMTKATGSGTQAQTSAQPAPVIRLTHLLEDIGGMLKHAMRVGQGQDGTKMRLNIFPEHLGHLEILLTSINGKVAAQIMASTPMAKEALELQLNQLRVSLVQQGVEVEKIEVLEQPPQPAFSQHQSHADQRFSQTQQKKHTASQDKSGYAEIEPSTVHIPAIGQVIKVDYTV